MPLPLPRAVVISGGFGGAVGCPGHPAAPASFLRCMIPACLTTLLWSFCIVASRRSLEQLGEHAANFWRILVAVCVLGVLTHASGFAFRPESFPWFFLSGLVGFGLGDIGLYFALSRLGSRLTILMAQCAAVPIAFLAEWSLLGNLLSWRQSAAIVVILAGIVLALLPSREDLPIGTGRRFGIGILFGLLAATGQGLGGVFSRLAYQAQGTTEAASTLDGILLGAAAGYQRLLGGVLLIGLVFLASRLHRPWRTAPTGPRALDSSANKTTWVFLNALSGPILGIIFIQWAFIATNPAVVQSIVALTPLTVIPLVYWMEGERPRPRSVLGGLVAVAGVILLALIRARG
jgi:drug/metabolite transporter (DMT)-like permease